MRGFIKTCGGFFVVAGMLVVATGCITALVAIPSGFGGGIIVALGAAASGASIVLVGGGVYLLANIDERIERLTNPQLAPALVRPPLGEAGIDGERFFQAMSNPHI